MSVVLTILKVLGWVLLGLLALIVALLFVPAKACFSYESSRLLVRAGALGFWIEIYDSAKKKEPKESGESTQPEESEPKLEAKTKSEPDIELLKTMISAGGRAVVRVLRGLRIRHICVTLIAHGFDPYETGVKTGKIWAGIGAALTLLRSIWRDLGVDRLEVIPDFMGEHKGCESISCEISSMSIGFVAALAIFGWRYLRYKIKKRSDERREQPSVKGLICNE